MQNISYLYRTSMKMENLLIPSTAGVEVPLAVWLTSEEATAVSKEINTKIS